MLGRGNGVDYPLGADLYPFSAERIFGIGLHNCLQLLP